jgi:hypothetical protein
MKIINTVQSALLIGMGAVLLIPTVATARPSPATVTLSIKESPEKPSNTDKEDGNATLFFEIAKSGWKTFQSGVDSEKDRLNFDGTYVSGATKAESGIVYAWLVDPKEPSVVSEKLTIKYETSDEGLTQVEGSFQPNKGSKNLGALPEGVGVFELPSKSVDIAKFYNGKYKEAALPGRLSISVQSSANAPPSITAVEKPAEYAIVLLGLGMVGYQVRRKQRRLSRTQIV